MNRNLIIVVIFINFIIIITPMSLPTGRYHDYKNHTCIRDCSKSTQPMICEYDFILETYTSMSRACYLCPLNGTDCLREHCVPVDGYKRTIQVANRLLPGPSIQVCKGDTIVVNVENRLEADEGTSIHWHGMRQKNTNFMDGPAMITQCPIMRNNKMRYEYASLLFIKN